LTGDDFGANARYGIYASEVKGQCGTTMLSSGWIIAGSQFGGNKGGDIYANGSAVSSPLCIGTVNAETAGLHTITGNAFIGAGAAGLNSIQFTDAGGNTVSGNTWGYAQPTWVPAFNYAVVDSFSAVTGTQQYPTYVVGNSTIPGQFVHASPYSLVAGLDPSAGLPIVVAANTLTGQTGSVASFIRYTPSVAGIYRVTGYIADISAGGTGCSLTMNVGTVPASGVPTQTAVTSACAVAGTAATGAFTGYWAAGLPFTSPITLSGTAGSLAYTASYVVERLY
jgi:hypothetical protein